MAEAEEKVEGNWYEWLRNQRPLIQTVFRAIQSIASKAEDGADVGITIGRDTRNPYVLANTRTVSFAVEYDSKRVVLKAYWERKKDAENYSEYKVKRAYEYVEDEGLLREFVDTVAELLMESVRRGFDADRACEKLKPLGERLAYPGANPTEVKTF
jgi:hypothetical protein